MNQTRFRTPSANCLSEAQCDPILAAGREKGHERVRVLKEQAPLARAYLAAILARRGLVGDWREGAC